MSQATDEQRKESMMQSTRYRNLKVLVPAIGVIGIMLGLVAYSPTLYRLFCGATGYGGTTQRADADTETVSDRTITVRFDSNVAPGLAWRFEPAQREVKVHLGEQQLVSFTAENLTDQPIVGHATFNVTPQTTGIYFNKIQCFCFDEERLDSHQKVDMPVVFFVDPALATDPETRDVDTITLSYTFFRSVNPENAKDLSRFVATAEPDAIRGQHLFGERCASCHALGANKTGPMLGGAFDRKAGSAVDYKYSPALQNADIKWSRDNLDRWLTDPRKFIVGARMPVRVLDAAARRNIIAYLEKETREMQAGPNENRLRRAPLINVAHNEGGSDDTGFICAAKHRLAGSAACSGECGWCMAPFRSGIPACGPNCESFDGRAEGPI